MTTLFKLGKAAIECVSGNTRNGFKHTATLRIDGFKICTVTCTYLNRTWEAYEYESVFQKILSKTDALTERQKTLFRKKYDVKY
ncbi:MAG: hypothetical protein QQN41_10465 [Nitrosopumilus sp.]